MTRILPHPHVLASSQLASVPQADGHRTSDQRDFASLLVEERATESIDLLGAASALVDDPKLAQAIAEVFNAHGFFASASGSNVTPATARPNSADSEASRHLPAQFAVLPSVGDPNESIRIDRPGQVQLGSQPISSTVCDIAIQPWSSRSPGQPPPALASVAGRPISAGAAIAGSEGNATEPPNERPSPQRRATASSTADRLIFQIGTHVVQLIGRMQGLHKDEQEQLVARLTALLESHGLSIGAATVNGRPLREAILRSNH